MLRSSIAIAATVDNLIVFFQVVHLLGDVDSVWPDQVRGLMQAFSFLRLNISVFSFQCALQIDFAQTWRTTVFGAWFVVMVQFFFGVTRELFRRCACWRRGQQDQLPTLINFYRAFNASLYTMQILFLISTSSTFQAFSCYAQPDGSLSMRAYPKTRCYSPEWRQNFLSYAAVSLCVTVIGYPLGLLAIYVVGFARYAKHSAFNRMTMVVTNPYKPRFYWWEGIELCRKLALVSIMAFVSEPQHQLAAAALLVLVVGIINLRVRPFKQQSVNMLSGVCMGCLVVVLICGLGLRHVATGPAEEREAAVVAFAVVIFAVCVIVPALALLVLSDLVVVLGRAQMGGHVMSRVMVDESVLRATLEMVTLIEPRDMIAQIALSIGDAPSASEHTHQPRYVRMPACLPPTNLRLNVTTTSCRTYR